MEGRAAVPIWEWEFRGMLVAASAARLCLYVSGQVESSSLEQGCRTHNSCWSRGVEHTTQLNASQTRRLRESRKICLVDPSFPCGPGGCALGDVDMGSHPRRLRRANDGDFHFWGQNLRGKQNKVCGDVWQVNDTYQPSKQQLPISSSGDTSFL